MARRVERVETRLCDQCGAEPAKMYGLQFPGERKMRKVDLCETDAKPIEALRSLSEAPAPRRGVIEPRDRNLVPRAPRRAGKKQGKV